MRKMPVPHQQSQTDVQFAIDLIREPQSSNPDTRQLRDRTLSHLLRNVQEQILEVESRNAHLEAEVEHLERNCQMYEQALADRDAEHRSFVKQATTIIEQQKSMIAHLNNKATELGSGQNGVR